MKKLLAIFLISLVTTNVFAATPAVGGDMEKVVFDCTLANVAQGYGIFVKLYEGGLSGVPRLELTEYLMSERKKQVINYFVRQQAVQSQPVGAPLMYVGPKATFSINMTTTPLANGQRAATLTIKDAAQPVYLSCK